MIDYYIYIYTYYINYIFHTYIMIYSCIIIVFGGAIHVQFPWTFRIHPWGQIRETRFLSALELVVGGAWGDLISPWGTDLDGDGFLFGKTPSVFRATFLGGETVMWVLFFSGEFFWASTPTLLGSNFVFLRRISWASPQHCLEHKLVEDF